jgi:hypothetical protein
MKYRTYLGVEEPTCITLTQERFACSLRLQNKAITGEDILYVS